MKVNLIEHWLKRSRIRNYFVPTVVLVLMLSIDSAVGQNKPQVITVPLSRPTEPVSLKIEIFSARIEVIGEDRQDAEFTITPSGDDERKIITPSGAKPLPEGSYAVDVHENNNILSVESDSFTSKVGVIARIPRHADLDLTTQHNGEIVVRDIMGSLQLQNSNGPISATNIHGSVIAEGMNEAITVSLSSLNERGAMALSSMNGEVNLSLPAKAGVELHIDTAKGDIRSDFEMDVKPSKPVIERADRHDGVSVRLKDSIVATINGGGPAIRIKTLNGDIRITKSGN